MRLEKIEITLTSNIKTTSGIKLSGVFIVVPKHLQVFSVENNYHVFLSCYVNKECYENGKTQIEIEGLHEVVDLEGLGSKVINEVELIMAIGPGTFTYIQKKNIIISKIASLLNLPISDFT